MGLHRPTAVLMKKVSKFDIFLWEMTYAEISREKFIVSRLKTLPAHKRYV
jgi:hypothetical protein